MKSRLFSAFDEKDEENKEFVRHLGRLVAMPVEDQNACLDAFPRFVRARTAAESHQVSRPVEAQTGDREAHILDIFRLLRFFLEKMMLDPETREDSVADWAEDLLKLGLIADDARGSFVGCIERLRDEILPMVRGDVLERIYAAGVLPTINEFGVTVEFRAVQTDKYRPDSAAADYTPNIVGMVPVASLHVGVDRGAVNDFCFQADERELDMMINALEAAKKEIAALKQFVSRSQQGG